MKNIGTPATTRELMKKFDFKMTKRLGQNFLVDEGILNDIIGSAKLTKEDCVLEIGPGMGAMTQLLCDGAGKVLAVEIDKKLIPILKVTMFGYENIDIINDDILKLDLKQVLSEHFGEKPAKVVANLPYYITTPIIMMLLEEHLNIESITIMVQKEVGERLKAAPGGKDYGALSVAVQYYCIPQLVRLVPSESFIPRPEVDSIVIRLDVRKKPAVEVKSEELFFRVVKASFGQRRKTLLNALSAGNLGKTKEEIRSMLTKLGIDENRRGETLSLSEFAMLSDSFLQK